MYGFRARTHPHYTPCVSGRVPGRVMKPFLLATPKYPSALRQQMPSTSCPSKPPSFGISPRSTSPPIRSHRMRRKYSCRGNDRNERESVVIPMNRESKPTLDKQLRCSIIPCFWSRNHQGGPHCIARVTGSLTCNLH